MKIRDIKAALLQRLYLEYQEHGSDWGMGLAELEELLPGARPGSVEATLDDFRSSGLVDYSDTSDVTDVRLTVEGIEAIEDPETEAGILVHAVTVTGGNVQIGSHNQQTVTYQNVINSLIDHVERATDVPAEQKKRWTQTLREIAVHPCTQTALGALAGFATAIATK